MIKLYQFPVGFTPRCGDEFDYHKDAEEIPVDTNDPHYPELCAEVRKRAEHGELFLFQSGEPSRIYIAEEVRVN